MVLVIVLVSKLRSKVGIGLVARSVTKRLEFPPLESSSSAVIEPIEGLTTFAVQKASFSELRCSRNATAMYNKKPTIRWD